MDVLLQHCVITMMRVFAKPVRQVPPSSAGLVGVLRVNVECLGLGVAQHATQRVQVSPCSRLGPDIAATINHQHCQQQHHLPRRRQHGDAAFDDDGDDDDDGGCDGGDDGGGDG
eukprot:3400479-Alexandrium_andersonii.AAC.1